MKAPTFLILALAMTTPAQAKCHKYSHWAYPYPQTCKIYRAYAPAQRLAMKSTGPAIAALKPMFVPPIFIPDIEVPNLAPPPPPPPAPPTPTRHDPPVGDEAARAIALQSLRPLLLQK